MSSGSLLSHRSEEVKGLSKIFGFQFCGISRAGFLEEEAPRLEAWLQNGHQGKMHYLENHFDKRLDPSKLVPGAKSVVSLIFNYYPKDASPSGKKFKVARYAYGEDYHRVVKDKLFEFLHAIREKFGSVEGRAFVDSGPVMERQWAQKSGLGWLGKNGLLLNQSMGSYFFLAELIIDLELEPDQPVKDHCGTCTACIDACPTDAIIAPGVLNASRCISYLNIELKDSIPNEFSERMDGWIFGCDVCQEVCPWNRFSKPTDEPAFQPTGRWSDFTDREWQEITAEVFKENFGRSAVLRTGYGGLKRNIRFVTGQSEESGDSGKNNAEEYPDISL